MTREEIRRKGLEALREKLGQAGMIQFIQQFENGHGDYVIDRQEWADSFSLDTLKKPARSRAKPRK